MNIPFAARHSSESPDWYTPSSFVEAARQVMGSIDLDPCSCEEANRIVKATRFYDEECNGLKQPWFGNVFVNPPGGLVREFWEMFVFSGFEQGVWIGYSLEQLQTLQAAKCKQPMDFTMCVPRQRIAFVENAAKQVGRLEKLVNVAKRADATDHAKKRATRILSGWIPPSQPSHANYIVYRGHERGVLNFMATFAQFGIVR